jgi:alpha-tubulin suppressor-like RCC1 family protein
MVSAAAGTNFTVGLKKDGQVLATGRNDHGQCDVSHLSNIKQISAGMRHVVFLRKDGSVTAAGCNESGECNVHNWRHIVHVTAGYRCTFGIKKDGHLLFSGHNPKGDLQVSHLQNVADVAFSAPGRGIALLKKGTVARIGKEDSMHKNLSRWKGLMQISSAPDYFAGLFSNGLVRLLAYFWPETGIECATHDWRDIQAIAAGRYHILGLRKDGTVEAAMLHPDAHHDRGQCGVNEWRLA